MGRALTFAVFFCALAGRACGQEEDEEEAKPVLLLYKKMDPMTDFAVGQPINITHTVFNKGLGNAYSVMVNDDFWKPDKFSIIGGTNNFTLDFLNAGDQYTSYLTVVPIKKGYARVRAARMAYIDGVEGENLIMAYSNTLPEMKILNFGRASSTMSANFLVILLHIVSPCNCVPVARFLMTQ